LHRHGKAREEAPIAIPLQDLQSSRFQIDDHQVELPVLIEISRMEDVRPPSDGGPYRNRRNSTWNPRVNEQRGTRVIRHRDVIPPVHGKIPDALIGRYAANGEVRGLAKGSVAVADMHCRPIADEIGFPVTGQIRNIGRSERWTVPHESFERTVPSAWEHD